MTPDNIAVDYDAQVRQLRTRLAGKRLKADKLLLHFDTDTTTSLALNTEGLDLTAGSPMHVMTLINRLQPLLKAVSDSTVIQPITSLSDLSMLDTLRPLIPPLRADIRLRQGSPAQPFIDDTGLDIDQLNLTLNSDSLRTDLAFDAAIPTIGETNAKANTLRLPPAKASLNVAMTDGRTNASLTAGSRLTDGAMGFYGLCTDAGVRMDLERKGRELYGNGQLTLDSINYNNTDLGNHTIDMRIAPSDEYAHAIRAEVETEAIPLDIVEGFVELPDIALRGAVRAAASVDGLPAKTDISAEVHPLNISALYKPYDVGFSLGETPVPIFVKPKVTPEDRENYQTIFAAHEGAVAVPAAGTHFSRELFNRMILKDINKAFITVHMGIGQFRRAQDPCRRHHDRPRPGDLRHHGQGDQGQRHLDQQIHLPALRVFHPRRHRHGFPHARVHDADVRGRIRRVRARHARLSGRPGRRIPFRSLRRRDADPVRNTTFS